MISFEAWMISFEALMISFEALMTGNEALMISFEAFALHVTMCRVQLYLFASFLVQKIHTALHKPIFSVSRGSVVVLHNCSSLFACTLFGKFVLIFGIKLLI